ncbi:helix-turn-helix transcriptional regulator [Nonomuraea glycinis]|uniref:helix-turn-helix transcriptional regulator n=1 Tax=Nonomuraea glycinis TaxID=2047744 RepID=UPI002E0F9D11|nr:LuxR C-terminal-related transcriptional regulator [Nonomuraea glycinis]
MARAEDLFGRLRATFEQARTDLCRGESLRRARKRIAARDYLSWALSGFDRLRAGPWADRTRTELEATGAPVRRRETSAAPPLTAQELQVAKLAAEGEGNREIATALFLSHKTVEFHIRNLHRKLGTTSRARLVRKLLEHSLMG